MTPTEIQPLLFLNFLYLHCKDESQIGSLVNDVYTFSNDIRMRHALKNSGVLVLKRSKINYMDGLVTSSGEIMEKIEGTGCNYLEILEMYKLMGKEMRGKFKVMHPCRLRQTLK